MLKNPPAMQETHETWVLSLGQEDPLELGMATHSSVLAWRIPWTEDGFSLIKILVALCGIWDLSFMTRDQTHAP